MTREEELAAIAAHPNVTRCPTPTQDTYLDAWLRDLKDNRRRTRVVDEAWRLRKARAARAGKLSAHNRYHRDRGVYSPTCPFC